MITKVIFFINLQTKEYFWSTSHIQKLPSLPNMEDFTPITMFLPREISPRESLPDGIMKTREDIVKIHLDDMKEISNPDPAFQPTEIYTPQQLFQKAMLYHTECMRGLRESCDFKRLSDLIISALKIGYQYGIDREDMDIPEAL